MRALIKSKLRGSIAGEIARVMMGSPAARRKALIIIMNRCRDRGLFNLANFISNRLKSRGLYISSRAKISESVKFPHPIAIVIGEGVVIEENARIYQNVTLGGARVGDWEAGRYPTIGAGTVVFAGAVIVGDIKIGKNCVVGANSVVLKDVPDNAVCVGAPGRVVSVKK
ncbi:MAG: hypothetical protein Q8L99_04340 [Polycyclovorans sp.]|nr:hypothetical protein [Polycyclovorans sp.]